MERLVGIIIALLALGIMMTIHELGHFLTGKKLGFKIEEFMIFMGPVLWAWEKEGIRYSIRLFPIGAAVQFAGEYEGDEDNSGKDGHSDPNRAENIPALVYDKDDPGLFMNRPKRYRAAVLAAGSAANIASGILIFALLFMFTGYILPELSMIPPESQAAAAGLQPGDEILEIAGSKVNTNLDAAFASSMAGPADDLEIKVRRADGTVYDSVLKPEEMQVYRLGITTDGTKEQIEVLGVADWQNNGSPVFRIGDIILEVNGQEVKQGSLADVLEPLAGQPAEFTIFRDGGEMTVTSTARQEDTYTERGLVLRAASDPLRAIPYAFQYSWSTIQTSFKSLVAIFRGMVDARDTLTGPVGIIDTISGVVADEGFQVGEKLAQLANLVAVISLALGFTNLLPIPLLDGNHLLLLAVEAVRGKRLSSRAQTAITVVGLAIIIFLFAFGLYSDISRILGR